MRPMAGRLPPVAEQSCKWLGISMTADGWPIVRPKRRLPNSPEMTRFLSGAIGQTTST